jgi:hypothetical protein
MDCRSFPDIFVLHADNIINKEWDSGPIFLFKKRLESRKYFGIMRKS